MKTIAATVLLLVAGALRALPPVEASLPASPWADTEISTNVPFASREAKMKRFEFALTFAATPSNNVQVAFGRDADGDGVLGPEEEDAVVGWDCGEWFARGVAAGERLCAESVSTNLERTLAFVFRTRVRDGGVTALDVTVDGVAPFPSLADSVPAWLYAPDWNLLRLTARGVGDPDARFRVRTVPGGFGFIFR